MAAEFYTRLRIFSDKLTPDQLSSRIGIQHEWAKVKGDPKRPGVPIYHKQNIWAIRSQISRDKPINEHIDDLLKRIIPVIDILKEISVEQGNYIEFGCILRSEEEPSLFITKEQIQIISKIGADIDIDLYYHER